MDLKEKIENRMDHLQKLMEGQAHIDRPEYVRDVLESISKFWSALSGDDKEYIQMCQWAIDEQRPWNV